MSSRSHLRVVASNEQEKVTSNNATWKFELFETVNSDPLCDSSCLPILVAYSHFCRTNERNAYLSEIDLQVRTGLQPRALRKGKEILTRLAYLTAIGKTSAGIIIYRLADPRRQMIADHRTIAAETLKEADAFKREEERRKRRVKGSRCAPPGNDVRGADMHPTRGADMHPNSLDATVEEGGIDAEGSYTGGLGAYVRERWTMPDEGWPTLRRDEPDGEAP